MKRPGDPKALPGELRWLRELERHVPAFRDAVRTAAKVDGALNEIRIAREKKK